MPLGFNNMSGGGYGSAVPFQRIIEPQQLGFFLNLEQAELLRIQRYGEAQRFYLGKHWTFSREDGEPLVTVNYIRKLVDKSTEFLAGKGFSVKVPDPLLEVSLPFLKEVWTYNNAPLFLNDTATMGGITGDAFVMVTFEHPTDMARRVNPYSQGKIRINLLGSEQVYPTWDPLNHEILTAVRIETIFYAERGVQNLNDQDRNHQGRQLYTKRFTQIITATQIVEQFHGEMPVAKVNLLGEIPLVHIKNISMPKEYYGLSDVQDLIDLQREYNEKSTDISDIINYQASPVTVLFGAKAKNLERGAKQMWTGLPVDARVEVLNLDTDLPASNAYLDRVKTAMHELSDVPEGSLGKMMPISNTSGVALSMGMFPLQSKTMKKRVTYGLGFQQINYFALRIGMIMGLINLPFDLCKNCGGRIVEAEVPGRFSWIWQSDASHPQGGQYFQVPLRRTRCFHVNKKTMEFMDPREMRLKFVRQYGFGQEVREAPFWMIEREMKTGKPSYWDYAADQLKEMQEYTKQVAAHGAEQHEIVKKAAGSPPPSGETSTGAPIPGTPTAAPPPPPPPKKVCMLPAEFIDVPEEPEEVELSFPLSNPTTGEVVQIVQLKGWLVPTGCEKTEYLNPFVTEVEFHDVMPKDESLEAQLFFQYLQMGVVDPFWVRRHISTIAPDADELEKRMKRQQQVAPDSAGGGYQELAPNSETGQNGNPTPTEGQSEQQQQGAAKKAAPGAPPPI